MTTLQPKLIVGNQFRSKVRSFYEVFFKNKIEWRRS
ncbi:hypothetical protein CF65_01448 [Aggregatibacter actinomycetemcomitans HK1651]|nr:hypothetical protein CF65_01448 [Aggregatibacter actinomycetemcomitans HK1651]